MSDPQKPSVFISYRRSDAITFAIRLHEALEAQGIDAWLDVRDMPTGDTFIAQIDRAIDHADYFLLVATPNAIESDYCRDEWKKAIEKYKPIIPLMLMGDYQDLPQEAYAYLNDARDFRDDNLFDAQLQQLSRQIQLTPSKAGEARGLPSLPSHYLPRPELLKTLRETLTQHKTTVLTSPSQKMGIQGMGGVGKSVLAMAIARDYFVRRSFKDGVFWLTFGTEPRLFDLWSQLVEYLGYDKQFFKDAKEAQDFFEKATHNKEILLILDDVWNSDHAKAFLHLGENCRLFVSSRQSSILSAIDAHTHAIGILSDTEAQELLKRVAKVATLPAQSVGIIRACGNLPLALAMIGAMVQGKKESYWQDALDALTEADLEEIGAKFPEYAHANLFLALKVSLDALDDDLRERYYDFAIFPDDVAIPENVPLMFWKPSKPRDVRKKLDELVSRNLLNLAEDGTYSLHDLQLTYLRRETNDKTARHNRLLQQYRPQDELWHKVCDAYLWKYLAHHLIHAQQSDVLIGLLSNFEFLQAKLNATDVNAILEDFDDLTTASEKHLTLPSPKIGEGSVGGGGSKIGEGSNTQNKTPLSIAKRDGEGSGGEVNRFLSLLRSALLLSANALNSDKNALAHQLVGRLMGHRATHTGIRAFTDWIADHIAGIYPINLDDEYATHLPAGGALIRTLEGHTDEINGALELANGNILSWSNDGTLRIWKLDGSTQTVLEGHKGWVVDVIVLSEGRLLSWSGGFNSNDFSLRLWSVDKASHVVLTGHASNIFGAMELSDGRILSWSWDNTLRVWSSSGDELRVLAGHTKRVNDAIELSDGRILSWSEDEILRLWSSAGDSLSVLEGHRSGVNGVILVSDGRILSWSNDTTLRLWSSEGKQLAVLEGHTRSVEGAKVLSNGNILSWSEDGTLRLWSYEGKTIKELRGHTQGVIGVMQLSDGRLLSWSDDTTLRLWDSNGQTVSILDGHTEKLRGAMELSDGHILSWGWDNTLRLWSIEGHIRNLFEGHTSWIRGVLELQNADLLSWAGGYGTRNTGLHLWDKDKQSIKLKIPHSETIEKIINLGNKILSWSPYDKILHWWNKNGKIIVSRDVQDNISSVLGLSTGRLVIWSKWDTILYIWDADGQVLATLIGHTSNILGALELPHGRILSWSSDKTLRIWSSDGEELAVLIGHTDKIIDAEKFSDGRILSWSEDNTLRIWSSDGEELATLRGHTKRIKSVIAHRVKILSWGEDDTLRSWDMNGQTLSVIDYDSNYYSVPRPIRQYGSDKSHLFPYYIFSLPSGNGVGARGKTLSIYDEQTRHNFIGDADITALEVLDDGTMVIGDEAGRVLFLGYREPKP